MGNIDSPRVKATNKQPGDTDVIPETAFRHAGEGSGYENYHTGVSIKSYEIRNALSKIDDS